MTGPDDGRILRLGPGRWGPGPGEPHPDPYEIQAVRIHPATGGAWVIGHDVTCVWSPEHRHAPCVQVWVTSSGLAEALDRDAGTD